MSVKENSAVATDVGPEKSSDSIEDNDVIVASEPTENSNESVDANSNQEDNEIPTLAIRMLNIVREFTIFCVVMIAYAALTKDPPKITKSPAAYPFFPKDSIVRDWYRGEISKAIEYTRQSDISFVMYYAPWDAQSQAARNEFEITANYLKDYVTFVAVNCWQPHSECRTHYNKVYKWPVLIAYTSYGTGFQYNGLLKSTYMIRFLEKFMMPVQLAEKPYDFENAFAVATVNTSPGSKDFSAYYLAALKYLEKDPLYQVTFKVNSVSVSRPSLMLMLWNETLIFGYDQSWTPDEISQWIFNSVHHITSWVVPSGSKSFTFSNLINGGPFLLLFTPRNLLFSGSDYYYLLTLCLRGCLASGTVNLAFFRSLCLTFYQFLPKLQLQEIGYEYHKCGDNLFADLQLLVTNIKRSTLLLMYNRAKKKCKTKEKSSDKYIGSRLGPVWFNTSSCLHKNSGEHCKLLTDSDIYSICSHIMSDSCKKSARSKDCDILNDKRALYKTSRLNEIEDIRSAESLLKLSQSHSCKQFFAAEKLHPAVFENNPVNIKNISISGLACSTNKSLSLLAMDSLTHYHFAERLGIDLTILPDKTAAVIVHPKMESHYVLEGPINRYTLKQFIYNFTYAHLTRSLDSIATLKPKNTTKVKSSNASMIVVQELNSNTFLPTIMQQNMNVLVFYYTKYCSFCSGVSYVFLTVARKLRYLQNLIFTRIDGDINILPWEYTMDVYPTILFLPTSRKAESRVFPSELPLNVPNLIGFILTNLEPYQKLQAMWSICIQTKIKEHQSSCNAMLRAETLTQIERTLKEWRKSNKRQKKLVLHKLKQLRHLHLSFAHYTKNVQLISNHFQKLNQRQSSERDYRIKMKDEL